MQKRLILIFNLLLFTTAACYSQTSPANAPTEHMLRQATIMGQAFVKGNYPTFCKYTHPTIIKLMGGTVKMTKVMADGINGMKQQGTTFDSFSVDHPSKMIKVRNELQCTLEQHIVMKMKKGKLSSKSTLIAISMDGGKNWVFAGTTDKDLAAMQRIIPGLSNELVIAKEGPPEYIK